mgnify:CR=1 FL=1
MRTSRLNALRSRKTRATNMTWTMLDAKQPLVVFMTRRRMIARPLLPAAELEDPKDRIERKKDQRKKDQRRKDRIKKEIDLEKEGPQLKKEIDHLDEIVAFNM